jgi:hypothetical protein
MIRCHKADDVITAVMTAWSMFAKRRFARRAPVLTGSGALLPVFSLESALQSFFGTIRERKARTYRMVPVVWVVILAQVPLAPWLLKASIAHGQCIVVGVAAAALDLGQTLVLAAAGAGLDPNPRPS